MDLKAKIYRFLKLWFIFGHYILICSYVFMFLEKDEQIGREVQRNQTFYVLEQMAMVNAGSLLLDHNEIEENVTEGALIVLSKMRDEGNKRDPQWDLVNSIYYCSSLYTTVGKVPLTRYYLNITQRGKTTFWDILISEVSYYHSSKSKKRFIELLF